MVNMVNNVIPVNMVAKPLFSKRALHCRVRCAVVLRGKYTELIAETKLLIMGLQREIFICIMVNIAFLTSLKTSW